MLCFRCTTVPLLLLLAACQSAPEPEPSEPVLPHETFTLMSPVLGETRRINLYLPPGYAGSPDARYPVLYMPDGGVAEDFPHLTRTVDSAIRAHAMRPVIVVGIENTERRRDMTPPTVVEAERGIAPRVGGSAGFRAFLRDELRPVVDRRVRSNGENGIIGESLAGLFVIETLLREPELFSVYVALSPSLYWNQQELLRSASERLRARPQLTATLWLTWAGDDDLDGVSRALVATLHRAAPVGLRWTFLPMPAEHHSTIYRAAAPSALRHVYPVR